MNYGSRQEGSLRLRDRARGPAGWELRYRTTDHDGRRKLKSTIIGTIEEYPTKAAARAQIRTRAPLLNIARTSRGQTVGDLITKSEGELAAIPNFGRKSIDEVVETLQARGLDLRED